MKLTYLFLCIAVMAGVTYLIRMLPFALFHKNIESPFIRTMLAYLPYAVLSAMSLPGIFYSTGDWVTATVGTVVAVVLSYFKCPMIVVAVATAAAALITGFFR